MPSWLATRESVKRASGAKGSDRDDQIDELIQSATDEIYRDTNRDNDARRFVPYTALVRLYRFPIQTIVSPSHLLLDGDLQSVDSLTRDGTDVTAIASTDYFLEPNNLGPPYHRIEIDLASTAFFAGKDTPQRALTLTGTFARHSETATAGSLGAAIANGTDTSMQVKNGRLVEVGHTVLIGTEQVRVTDISDNDIGTNVAGSGLTASVSDTALTLGDPADNLNVGEVIRINSETLRVTAVTSATVVTVERAYDGSTLAAHSSGDDIFVRRTYTIVRGVNGTTAAAAADDAAISTYVVPADVRKWCRGLVIVTMQQEQHGWGREIGRGEGASEFRGTVWDKFQASMRQKYRWHAIGGPV